MFITGGIVTSVSGGKLSGGNLIQLTGSSGAATGMQRLTLVSPQGTAVPLNAATQRLVLAAASQVFTTLYLFNDFK